MKPIWISLQVVKKSFQKHPFLNEGYITSIVSTAIQTGMVKKIDEDHFEVRAKRKKDGDFVWVICTVHDRIDSYLVGKVHVVAIR